MIVVNSKAGPPSIAGSAGLLQKEWNAKYYSMLRKPVIKYYFGVSHLVGSADTICSSVVLNHVTGHLDSSLSTVPAEMIVRTYCNIVGKKLAHT
jgi:hypothetical protein